MSDFKRAVTDDETVLLAMRDADRAQRAREGTAARKDDRERGDGLRVNINAPHTVTCDGKNLAINIAPVPNAGGGGEELADQLFVTLAVIGGDGLWVAKDAHIHGEFLDP